MVRSAGVTARGFVGWRVGRASVDPALQTAVGRQLHEVVQQLTHRRNLIASHHGKLEWGSPVQPKTLEAILLHQIDLLDSRVQGFFDHVRADAGQEKWTLQNSPMHGTELRRPDDFPGS